MRTLQSCNQLTELDVSGCFALTEKSVEALAYSLRHLRKLTIDDCVNIPAQSLVMIIERYAPPSTRLALAIL